MHFPNYERFVHETDAFTKGLEEKRSAKLQESTLLQAE